MIAVQILATQGDRLVQCFFRESDKLKEGATVTIVGETGYWKVQKIYHNNTIRIHEYAEC